MENSKFDNIIHAPNRLQICALLSSLEQVEFRVIRDELGVSDSVLSKHIKQLEDVCYIKQKKSKVNGRERRWFHLTTKGRRAFELHVEELKRIVRGLL
ncbi:MAG: MarR family transcriptional regulator [Kordia sp.]|nr:MAG: MarR family transcriptional regulator [Kordia sp.]